LKPARICVGSWRWVRLRTMSRNSWLVGTGAIWRSKRSVGDSRGIRGVEHFGGEKRVTYILPSSLHDGPQESSKEWTDSRVGGCWGVRSFDFPDEKTKKLFVGHFCRAVDKCGGRDWMPRCGD
jgi:hypothetical protein